MIKVSFPVPATSVDIAHDGTTFVFGVLSQMYRRVRKYNIFCLRPDGIDNVYDIRGSPPAMPEPPRLVETVNGCVLSGHGYDVSVIRGKAFLGRRHGEPRPQPSPIDGVAVSQSLFAFVAGCPGPEIEVASAADLFFDESVSRAYETVPNRSLVVARKSDVRTPVVFSAGEGEQFLPVPCIARDELTVAVAHERMDTREISVRIFDVPN